VAPVLAVLSGIRVMLGVEVKLLVTSGVVLGWLLLLSLLVLGWFPILARLVGDFPGILAFALLIKEPTRL